MYVRLVTLISGLVLCLSENLYADAPVANTVVNPTVNSVASTALPAKALSVTVKLSNIKVEKTVQKKGDELYFSITEYSSLGHSKENRIPVQPIHWLSQNVEKLAHVQLWQGSVQPGEEIKLIISMMEQDNPPWNPDDLIGNAELIIRNEQGSIKKEWKSPIFEETDEVEMKGESVSKATQEFVFKGSKARYDVTFDVQTQ
jgi:hypothetical protein